MPHKPVVSTLRATTNPAREFVQKVPEPLPLHPPMGCSRRPPVWSTAAEMEGMSVPKAY